jgi:hypothetical protein
MGFHASVTLCSARVNWQNANQSPVAKMRIVRLPRILFKPLFVINSRTITRFSSPPANQTAARTRHFPPDKLSKLMMSAARLPDFPNPLPRNDLRNGPSRAGARPRRTFPAEIYFQ